MNPKFHDEFAALVPLFYSGELTDEEWALLQVHMAYCDSCREAFEQFAYIASDVIPAMAAGAAAELPSGPKETQQALREAEQRLMSRLENQPVLHLQSPPKSPWAWVAAGAIAASIAGGLIYGGIRLVRRPTSQQPVASVSSVGAPRRVESLVPDPQIKIDHDALLRDDERVASLESQLSEAKNRFTAFNVAAADAKHLLQTEQAQAQQLVAQRNALNQQLAAARADSQSLRDNLTAAEGSAVQQRARLTELEARVQGLNSALDDANASLDSKEKMIAFDRDLMLHDRDIRDVIGARNLYIADIYDTNANGKTAKPFGRIFYTKDSSLVFYGFDLDKQSGMNQPVAFQAWGSGTDRRPVSLGLFYQDDSHKRWVLKSRDAATLARLNMVFVTVEPPGGSSKPTGKQFLRAYLQIQPNHP